MIVHSVHSFDYICVPYHVACVNTQADTSACLAKHTSHQSPSATHITFFLNSANEIIYCLRRGAVHAYSVSGPLRRLQKPLERRVELPRNTNSCVCVRGRALSDPPRGFYVRYSSCLHFHTVAKTTSSGEAAGGGRCRSTHLTYRAEIRPRGYLPPTTTIRALGMAFVQAPVIVQQ